MKKETQMWLEGWAEEAHVEDAQPEEKAARDALDSDALASAQKRIEELEAQLARHPEQLRRVAVAVRRACVESDVYMKTWPTSADLDAIIAEALK